MSTLYDIIHILPVSLLTVMLFGKYAGIPEKSLPGYAFCLVFTLFIILLRNMKRKNRIRSIGTVSVFIAGLYLAAGEESRQIFSKQYFWVIRIVCFVIPAFIIGILIERNILIRRIAAAALLVFCIAGTVLKQRISKEVFFLICFLLFVCTAEEIQRKWQKSGCSDMKEHITRISPFFLAVCLTVYSLPAPDRPYDWQFAKDLWHRAVSGCTRVYGYLTHPSDDYGNIGFSDQGSFLSGLGENDTEALRIRADSSAVRDLPLIGCISGDFREREWVFDTAGRESCTRMLDTIETVCAVRKFAESSRQDYLQKTDLHCEVRFYNTRYVFSPAKIKLEATKEKNTGFSERNGSIVSKKRLNYEDDYTVSCFLLNYGNPHLAELLDNADPILKEEWDQTARAENALDKTGCSFEDYQQYRSDIYKTFCRSRGVSEQTEAILQEIKSNSESRYDAAKMLEAYLRRFSYSTSCGPLPDTVTDAGSYLDYFLFTSQKGYCMHFATAFVLMANEMGIPCRYVQGYKVRQNENGSFSVMQSNAHAWPEVYFEHAGWIAFEPTPGFSLPDGWETVESRTGDYGQNQSYPIHTGPQPEITDQPEAAQPEPKKFDLHIFRLPALGVLVFLLLGCLISRSVSRRKIARMEHFEKFRYLTMQNIRLLGYLGFRMKEDETLSEYLNRIMQSDRQELKAHLHFIPEYETVLYSDSPVTDEVLRSAGDTHQALRTLVKQKSLKYRIIGSGTTVLRQSPGGGEPIPKEGTVVLYTDTSQPSTVTVPDVVGLTNQQAIKMISNAGLNIRISGADAEDGPTLAARQTPSAGESAEIGSVITVEFIYNELSG